MPGSRTVAKTGPGSDLKVLVAGVDKDERGELEARVRQALGSRAASGPWSVSLVKLGGKWSVTLNGPGERFKNVSFTAADARLHDAIRDVVERDRESAVRGGAAPEQRSAPAGEARDEHVCPQCQRAVIVVYETRPGEAKVSAPLACPHCWRVSHVEVGAWAAAGGDYRAEKDRDAGRRP